MRVLVVTNMYPTTEMPAFGTFVYDQVEALRRAGLEVDVFLVNGRESTWNYLWGFFRFWKLIARQRYDLIHAHYILAGLIARAQWGHRVVLTTHGTELMGCPQWQTTLSRIFDPLFDEVIYVSEESRRAMGDTKGWVIPCGINVDEFHPMEREAARQQLGLPMDKRLILWAGEYWRPEKRYELTQQAVERVQRVLPDVELVLVTKQPHDVIPVYMSACDALLLTSDIEGSPMVIKEAMACDLPVVSVRVGDVPEVIGGVPGCALAERDPDDIAAKLVEVLREPRRSEGRSHIDHLSNENIAAQVIEVFDHALRPSLPRHNHAYSQ